MERLRFDAEASGADRQLPGLSFRRAPELRKSCVVGVIAVLVEIQGQRCGPDQFSLHFQGINLFREPAIRVVAQS